MSKLLKLERQQRTVDVLQRCVETVLALGLCLSQFFLSIDYVPLPGSIATVVANSTTILHYWSWISFAAYALVVVGVWLRPSAHIKCLRGKYLGDTYIYFELPGLITASFMTSVYVGALIANFGLFSPSIVAICSTGGIALYFLFRFIKLWYLLHIARTE